MGKNTERLKNDEGGLLFFLKSDDSFICMVRGWSQSYRVKVSDKLFILMS